MEGYKNGWLWTETRDGKEIKEEMSREDRVFSAIVLADSLYPACQHAYEALKKCVTTKIGQSYGTNIHLQNTQLAKHCIVQVRHSPEGP